MPCFDTECNCPTSVITAKACFHLHALVQRSSCTDQRDSILRLTIQAEGKSMLKIKHRILHESAHDMKAELTCGLGCRGSMA